MIIVMLQLPVVDAFLNIPLSHRKQIINDKNFVSQYTRQNPKSLIHMNSDEYLSNSNEIINLN